jgi:two-component system sensor histidine kinase RegB
VLLQLVIEVGVLAGLLYHAGGASNPFVSFYLVPITISAAILPWTYTWVITGFSILAYTLLLFIYQPLPQLMPAEMHMAEEAFPSLHIIGMWFNFLVSAALITYFVVKMASEIRAQDNTLNRYREENLRNEQILAVATQAAGTAHELGTPLNTMTLLVREMAADNEDNPRLAADIQTLESQLALCKGSLRELVNRADLRQAGSARYLTLRDFIAEVREQWSLIRPEVELSVKFAVYSDSPPIRTDSTLQQAVVNILNNAADASPDQVDMEIAWDTSHWTIRVRDYGEGINKEVVKYLGSKIISDKEKGMGVGMILSQASINRLGGQVMISSHPEQGTVTEIQMPFDYEVKD